MEVASQQKLGRISHGGLEFPQFDAIGLNIKLIPVIAMGGSNQMRSAVFSCHSAHGHRNFKRLGPVVGFRERMAVDINHRFLSQTGIAAAEFLN